MWMYLKKNSDKIVDSDLKKEVIKVKDDEEILKKRKKRVEEKFNALLAKNEVIFEGTEDEEI